MSGIRPRPRPQYRKVRTREPLSKHRGFDFYSMNKTGIQRKMFRTEANALSEQLRSTLSSPSQALFVSAWRITTDTDLNSLATP